MFRKKINDVYVYVSLLYHLLSWQNIFHLYSRYLCICLHLTIDLSKPYNVNLYKYHIIELTTVKLSESEHPRDQEKCSLFMIYHKYCVTKWEKFVTKKKCSYFGVVHFLGAHFWKLYCILYSLQSSGNLNIHSIANFLNFEMSTIQK